MQAVIVLLALVGLAGLGMGGVMFGDIGIAATVGGLAALLSAFGFKIVNKRLPKAD